MRKNSKKREISFNLELIEYMQVVMEIAAEYFVEDEYTPQFGILNAMRVFYNHCYKLPNEFEIIEGVEMADLVKDSDFMDSFNAAIVSYVDIGFDFSNAFHQALDIVEYNKTKKTSLAEILKNFLENIEETFVGMAENETFVALANSLKGVNTDGANATDLIQNFIKSDSFKEMIAKKQAEKKGD